MLKEVNGIGNNVLYGNIFGVTNCITIFVCPGKI